MTAGMFFSGTQLKLIHDAMLHHRKLKDVHVHLTCSSLDILSDSVIIPRKKTYGIIYQ